MATDGGEPRVPETEAERYAGPRAPGGDSVHTLPRAATPPPAAPAEAGGGAGRGLPDETGRPEGQGPPVQMPQAGPEPQDGREPKGGGLAGLLKGLFAGLGGLLRRDKAEAEEPAPAAPPPPEEVPGPQLPASHNPLYRVYWRTHNMPPPKPEDTFAAGIFVAGGTLPPEKPLTDWLNALKAPADGWLTAVNLPEEEPIDAATEVFVTPDRMEAWVFTFPPVFGGRRLQPDVLRKLLEEQGVVFGLDEAALEAACAEASDLKLVKVAAGLPPQNGEDGRVEDRFRRSIEIQLSMRDDGTIDYKDLGWLQVVYEGDVICDLIAPTAAVHGTDVRGGEVRGRDGKKAAVPKGQNTRVNEDESALVSTIDGVVTFLAGRFRVDPLLIIKGNVDNATGNLDVVGDVLIYGDVLEGFEVRASGNVTVQGMVEGAMVAAGKDIQVGAGVNGNSIGNLQAGGEMRCKFIENATVAAGQRVLCDNIINSDISSDSDIEVKTGRGAIIGGSITAGQRIDALSIGNLSNRSITITMGNSAAWLRQRGELEAKVKEAAQAIEGLQKNIAYLSAGGKADEGAGSLLGDMRLSLSVQQMQLAKTERQLAGMGETRLKNTDCRLRAEVIYPPAAITIGDAQRTLRETYYNALVYLKEGEVHVANV